METEKNSPNKENSSNREVACTFCGKKYRKTNILLHLLSCAKKQREEDERKHEAEKQRLQDQLQLQKNKSEKEKENTEMSDQEKKPSHPKPDVKKSESSKKSFPWKPIALVAAFVVAILAVIGGGFWLANSVTGDFESKIAAMEAEREAEEALQAKVAAEKAAAEAEELAKAPPTQPPFTVREEPPTVVRIDEFTVDTGEGEVLVGLPVIAGHGREGVYLGSAPPATEMKFAHDSKWTKADGWKKITIAQWDPNQRKYVGVPGIPMIRRTLPNGETRYQEEVWALVIPKP